jgi:hypothetical protein
MESDLFGTSRILFALLEKEGITIIRELESECSVQKLVKILLKASGRKLLNDILVDPMDKYSKHDSMESLRRKIMEHDEVFRQQVTRSNFATHNLSHKTSDLQDIYIELQKSGNMTVRKSKFIYQIKS